MTVIKTAAARPRTGRLATASIVGTTLEYYDFAVYNTLAALVFGQLFFASSMVGKINAAATGPGRRWALRWERCLRPEPSRC